MEKWGVTSSGTPSPERSHRHIMIIVDSTLSDYFVPVYYSPRMGCFEYTVPTKCNFYSYRVAPMAMPATACCSLIVGVSLAHGQVSTIVFNFLLFLIIC